MGLSVHAVVFGAPTLSSLLNTSHITLPYLCACVPERAQCGPQAAVLPVRICTYLLCSVTTNAYSNKHNEEQDIIYSFMQTKADCHAQNSIKHKIQYMCDQCLACTERA